MVNNPYVTSPRDPKIRNINVKGALYYEAFGASFPNELFRQSLACKCNYGCFPSWRSTAYMKIIPCKLNGLSSKSKYSFSNIDSEFFFYLIYLRQGSKATKTQIVIGYGRVRKQTYYKGRRTKEL